MKIFASDPLDPYRISWDFRKDFVVIFFFSSKFYVLDYSGSFDMHIFFNEIFDGVR